MRKYAINQFYLFSYLFEHSLFKQRHSLTAVRSHNNKSKHKILLFHMDSCDPWGRSCYGIKIIVKEWEMKGVWLETYCVYFTMVCYCKTINISAHFKSLPKKLEGILFYLQTFHAANIAINVYSYGSNQSPKLWQRYIFKGWKYVV